MPIPLKVEPVEPEMIVTEVDLPIFEDAESDTAPLKNKRRRPTKKVAPPPPPEPAPVEEETLEAGFEITSICFTKEAEKCQTLDLKQLFLEAKVNIARHSMRQLRYLQAKIQREGDGKMAEEVYEDIMRALEGEAAKEMEVEAVSKELTDVDSMFEDVFGDMEKVAEKEREEESEEDAMASGLVKSIREEIAQMARA